MMRPTHFLRTYPPVSPHNQPHVTGLFHFLIPLTMDAGFSLLSIAVRST